MFTLLAQVQQTAGCNALHNAEERLARWLLQTRDRNWLWTELGVNELVASAHLPSTPSVLAAARAAEKTPSADNRRAPSAAPLAAAMPTGLARASSWFNK